MALKWEVIYTEQPARGGGYESARSLYRAKVPGGWFVTMDGGGLTAFFYPDPEHTWDGSSLP